MKRVTTENLRVDEAGLRYVKHYLAAVSQAYFLLEEANQQLSLSQKSIDALTRQQRIVTLMFDNGSGDQQEFSPATSDLENARSEPEDSNGLAGRTAPAFNAVGAAKVVKQLMLTLNAVLDGERIRWGQYLIQVTARFSGEAGASLNKTA